MAQVDIEKTGNLERESLLQQWFQDLLPKLSGLAPNSLNTALLPVSGDASFRRYFRGFGAQSYILVDAPPDKEDSHPFVIVAQEFLNCGINVPIVHEVDYKSGFMCLSDFGDVLLWEKLDESKAQNENEPSLASQLYQLAFTQLLKIQNCKVDDRFPLPPFDKAMLHREMMLFREWFCEGLLGLSISQKESELIESSFQFLIDAALTQPQVCVHRDYHSRNLLCQEDLPLGVIDFQDAVEGPYTYDLVSLLKDCYIKWPRHQVSQWALEYAHLASAEGIISDLDEDSFLRSFDLMGIQRHLKAIGIFSRLYLRDGRLGYLADIPRTLSYILEVVNEFEELSEFSQWLVARIVPQVEGKVQEILSQETQS